MELGVFLLYVTLAAGVVVGGLLVGRVLRHAAPAPSPEPYECGETPAGSPYVPFRWPYLPLVALLVVLEAEIVLALPWVWVYRTLTRELLWLELTVLALPLVGVYGYMLWRDWLKPTLPHRPPQPSLPAPYQALNAYLASLGPKPSSYSSHPAEAEPPPSPGVPAVPQSG
ncbi:MAG: hypothetical protein KatS3mg025_1815 [Bacteroidia bacterium]|nr:MAG: hypothetical protein KatS3mg025_1815 [Bacteroidia bacterium]